MNDKLRRATDEQSEKWIKNDAQLLELGQAKHNNGQLVITDATVLTAIQKHMEQDLRDARRDYEQFSTDERLAHTFRELFGDKMEAYEQQMWDINRQMLEEDRFHGDRPCPVDFSQNEAIVQFRLNGTEVDDDLYARFLILPTNGQPMLAYSVRNANEVWGRVNRGARVYGEQSKIRMRARIGYLYSKNDEGDGLMAAKLDELKSLRRGDEFFEDASEEQKVAVLRYMEQLSQNEVSINVDAGENWRPKRSETGIVLE